MQLAIAEKHEHFKNNVKVPSKILRFAQNDTIESKLYTTQ